MMMWTSIGPGKVLERI